MQDGIFSYYLNSAMDVLNSVMDVVPLWVPVSIAACLTLVLVIKFLANALSGTTAKAGPKLLHVVPVLTVDESAKAQKVRPAERTPSPAKEPPLSEALLSEEVKRLFDQAPEKVAEPVRKQAPVLAFEEIEAPEIEPCGGVEVAFERYCAAARAGRLKNVAGDSMLLH